MDAVADIVDMLDSLGKEEAIFMGQSAGTCVIQEKAFQHRERVNAMVIIDGTCIGNYQWLKHWQSEC
jgi:pimeloyl-ACP methyl ester carboxylesterase